MRDAFQKLNALRMTAATLADEGADVVDAIDLDGIDVSTGRLAEAIRHVREDLPPLPDLRGDEGSAMTVEEYCSRFSETLAICEGHGGVNLSREEAEGLVAVVAAANDVVEEYRPGDLDADPENYAAEIKLRDAISSLVERFASTCEP